MSNVATWLRMQALEVGQDGSATVTIVLEGSDGGTWQTWQRFGRENLESVTQAVEGALMLFADEMPTGRHKVKLLALDQSEHQLGMLPLTVTGKSSAASAASSEALGMQRAVSLAVQNFEAMSGGLRHELQRVQERNDELLDSNITLLSKFLEIQTGMAELVTDRRREEKREERIGELWTDIKPMVEVVIGIVGDHVVQVYEQAKTAKRIKPNGSPKPDGSSSSSSSSEATHALGATPEGATHDAPPAAATATGGTPADHPGREPDLSPGSACAAAPPGDPIDVPPGSAGPPERSVRRRSRPDPELPPVRKGRGSSPNVDPAAGRAVAPPSRARARKKQPRSSTARKDKHP